MKLHPLDDRVVVEPNTADEVTPGGIVLPDVVREKPQRGKVLATGPGRLLESGDRAVMSLMIGDEVLFAKYGGHDFELDPKRTVKLLRESEILAKVV